MVLVWHHQLLAQTIDSIAQLETPITLSEVTVEARTPLTNNRVVAFYRSNEASSLESTLSRLDGISLIRRGAYAQEPQINGFSGGQVNITIDGMRLFGACTDKMDPVTSYVEPLNLESISLSKGSNSCSSGCNIGGALDMKLKEPIYGDDAYSTSLSMGYESVSNGINALFSTVQSNEKWLWGLDGVYRNNQNYVDGNGNEILYSQFEKINIYSTLKFLPNTKNHFKLDVLYDDARNVGYPALPMDVKKAQMGLVALEYHYKSPIAIKARLYYNSINHIMDDSQRDSLYTLTNSITNNLDTVFMRMDMPGLSKTVGAYAQSQLNWDEKNILLVKIDGYSNYSIAEMTMYMHYINELPEPPMYMQTWPAMQRSVAGVYLQNSSYLSPIFTLTINGRVDYNIDVLKSPYAQQQFSIFNYTLEDKTNRTAANLTVNGLMKLSNSIGLKASAGYANRIPTGGELLGYYLYNAYDGYDYVGNPYLKNEKSIFIEGGFTITQSKLNVVATQSFNFISDYIIGVIDSTIPPMNFWARGVRSYINYPAATMLNTNFQMLYAPTKRVDIFATVKYIYGQLQNGEPLPLISPLYTVLAGKYKIGKLTFQGEYEHAFAQNRVNKSFDEVPSKSYSLLNANGKYEHKTKFGLISASLGITNILNLAYYTHLDWGEINRPGRSIDLNIRFSF